MSTAEVAIITRTRLDGWADKLVSSHATPVMLIGIGHDHKSGELNLCIPDNLAPEMALNYLGQIYSALKAETKGVVS